VPEKRTVKFKVGRMMKQKIVEMAAEEEASGHAGPAVNGQAS